METAFHFSKVLKDRDGNADHGGELARVKVRFVPLHALSSACAALLESGPGLTPPRFSPFPAHSPQSSFRKTKEGWLDIETSNYFLEKVIAEQLPLNSAQPNTLTPEDVIRKGASAAARWCHC